MGIRSIEFRGKRVDNGEWVEGYYCRAFRWEGDKEPVPAIQENGSFMFRAIDPSTIGQYTGLTANGKKIFEGDILKGRFYGFPIIKDDFVFSISWQDDVKGFKSNYFEANLCEVIGNIHDNPELLKGK